MGKNKGTCETHYILNFCSRMRERKRVKRKLKLLGIEDWADTYTHCAMYSLS